MSLLFDFPAFYSVERKTRGTPGGRLGGSDFGEGSLAEFPTGTAAREQEGLTGGRLAQVIPFLPLPSPDTTEPSSFSNQHPE